VRIVPGVALAVCAGAHAAAAPLGFRAEASLYGGYDSNPYLLAPELQTDGARLIPTPDLYLEAAPRLLGEWTPGRHVVSLDYGLSYRRFAETDNGSILAHGGRFFWKWRPGPLYVNIAAELDAYQPLDSDFAGEGYFAVGGAPRVGWSFGAVDLSLEGALSRRLFAAGAENGGRARLALDGGRGRFWWGIDYRFDAAIMDGLDGGARLLHRGEGYVRWHPAAEVVMSAMAWAGVRRCTVCTEAAPGERTDAVAGGRGSLEMRPASWLSFTLGIDYLQSFSSDAAGRWSRMSPWFALGVALDRPARPEPEPDPMAPRPAAGGVRFTLRAPGAQAVAVAGTFNGWDPALGALGARGDGLFEGVVAVPPGEHLYMFVVDGKWVTPPSAPSFRADGFGEKNGVLIVP
jgi:hypothetical protein